MDPLELRRRCRETALHFLNVQREQFMRLGGLDEWEKSYVTLNPGYERHELDAFAAMVDKDLIYRGLKPVYSTQIGRASCRERV